jgi:1-acyl-sn-glycerol-3-phosphate acyltransferase
MKEFKGVFSLLWKLYVGAVFVFFAVVLYPFFYVLLLRRSWKKISFRLFVFWSWCMRIFCFYPSRTVLASPRPEGPYIIIANHSSYLDIFFMHSLLPDHPFLFLGKSEILGYPILRTYFKNLNIPVHRRDRAKAAKSFGMAKKAIEDGWSIVIFPEGTIPDDENPKMLPFKSGAFKLAKEMNIPIVPITFTNNYRLFSDPEQLLGLARPGIFRVYIHPFVDQRMVAELSEHALSEHCFGIINSALVAEHPHLATL